MKIASFKHESSASYGLVTERGIIDAGRRLNNHPTLKALLSAGSLSHLSAMENDRPDYQIADVELLPTIPDPDKIFCIGVNYNDHLTETSYASTLYPMIFSRFANSQVGGDQTIVRPIASHHLDFEGELAVVIGTGGRGISRETALTHVAGYSCYNDGSIRDWQKHTTQVLPGKNFPATGAFGPWLVTPDEIPDVRKLTITTRLNGVEMQHGSISDLIFDVPALIAYCSTFTELAPGDVIVTGTPSGIGSYRVPPVWMKNGDLVEVEIPGIGILRNRVEDESRK